MNVSIDCHVIKDLLPLYLEGMVSEETAALVAAHLDACADCRRELEELKNAEIPTPSVGKSESSARPLRRIMSRYNRGLHTVFCVAIVFFLLFGFSLTAGSDVLYNILIMPFAGVMAYLAFQWRAVYKLPILLLLTDAAALLLGLVEMALVEMLLWTLMYSLFALAGAVVAFLLHFAFGKEPML